MSSTAAEALQIVWGATLMRYVSGVGVVLVLYDWSLTLNDEMTLVWPGTLSLPKALYYINRYLSIVIMICTNYVTAGFRPPLSDRLSVCRTFGYVTGICFNVRFAAATALLSLRLAALYRGVRRVIWPLWIIFAICIGIHSTISIVGAIDLADVSVYSAISGQCLPTSRGRWGSLWAEVLAVVALTVLDIVFLVLTAFKARKTFLASLHSLSIMRQLLRDELLYFFVIVTTRSLQTVFVFAFPPALINVVGFASWGLEATIIARFFLNLRSIYHHRQYTGESQSAPSTFTPHRKLPFRRRSTKDDSMGVEVETRIYGSSAIQSERDISQGGTHGLGFTMELQTRHDGDERVVDFAADSSPKDETKSCSQS